MSRNDRGQLIALFALLGAAASALPASIPSFAEAIAVSVTELLNAVPLMFAGLFLGVSVAPLLAQRLREQRLIQGFAVVLATGILLVGLSQTVTVFLVSAIVLGVGFGALEVLGTAAAKRLQSDTASRLTRLNAVFAISAFGTPALLALASSIDQSAWVLYLLFAAALTFAFRFRSETGPVVREARAKKPTAALFVFMGAAILFVGGETVISGWSAVIASELGGFDAGLAALGGSSFWGLLAVGRILSVALTPRILTPASALPVWLLIATGSLLVAFISWDFVSAIGALMAFALATVAIGPCYALIIGMALDTQEAIGAVAYTSSLVLAGSLGGFVLPAILQLSPSVQNAALTASLGFAGALIFSVFGSFASKANTKVRATV